MALTDPTEAWLRRGLSRKTIAVYLVAVRSAAAQLDRQGIDVDTATAIEIAAWADRTLRPSRAARALARSSLRAYWTAQGRLDDPSRAIRVPRRPRMRCRALEPPQASLLAAAASRRALRGTRKGLAVLLGLYAGLRRSEIAGVRWADIGADGWLRVVGKGAERQIPLHPRLAAALAAFDGDRSGFVFGGSGGWRVNPTTVWTWVQELGREAGVPSLQTHVLRHTALATSLDATGDLRAVQELAGHARPETTAGYTRVLRGRLEAAAFAIDYPA